MEEEQLQVYNSDSAEEPFDADAISDELAIDTKTGWIHWYCALEGHQFLLQIEQEFIQDGLNMQGLLKQYNMY